MKIGLPLALQEFLTQVSFLALCAFVNRLGLEASSGYGVACKIVNFAMLVPSCPDAVHGVLCFSECGSRQIQNVRKKSMFTGIGVGLAVGCLVFVLVMFKGDLLAGFFSTDAAVIQNGYRLSERLCAGNHCYRSSFQHDRLFQRKQQDASGL